jgi:hypothetical protein
VVTVKKFRHYVGNRFQQFETGLLADKIDLSSYVPATDMHRYAAVWLDTYGNVAEVTTSTTQSLFAPLDSTDIDELVVNRPPDAIPHKAFYLSNNQGTVTQQAASDVDLRQFLNMPQLHGFTSPVNYRERIQPDRQVLFAGELVVTGELEVLGELVGIPAPAQGGTGGGAPADATYIVQTSSAGLSAEQALSTLLSGDMQVTTTTGVVASLKANRVATTNPTVTDDAAAGYSVGSRWINITLGIEYVCVDTTNGAAVWRNVTNIGTGWQDDGTVVRLVTTTDNVNIGGTTDLGKLAVIGDANEVQFRVRANGTQTATIFTIQDSSPATMFEVEASGKVIVNGRAAVGGDFFVVGDASGNCLYVHVQNESVGFGTVTPSNKTLIDAVSTTRFTRPIPTMTTTQRDVITSPPTGALLYNSTTAQFEYYDGAAFIGITRNALSNLASVAINTTLVSDTDNTDDLGTSSIKWREIFTNLATLEERTAPSTPASGDGSAYNKVSPTGQLFFVNDSGVHKQATESIAIIWDQKTSGTAGGSSSAATWNARDLNTEHYDPDGIVTISSNKFTVVAGDYELVCFSPWAASTSTATTGRNRLYNVTGAAVVQEGMSQETLINGRHVAQVVCKFTSNGTDEYRIDTYTSLARTGNGLGGAVSDGSAEVYTVVKLRKVA